MINQENALGESGSSHNEDEYESFSELLSALDGPKVEET